MVATLILADSAVFCPPNWPLWQAKVKKQDIHGKTTGALTTPSTTRGNAPGGHLVARASGQINPDLWLIDLTRQHRWYIQGIDLVGDWSDPPLDVIPGAATPPRRHLQGDGNWSWLPVVLVLNPLWDLDTWTGDCQRRQATASQSTGTVVPQPTVHSHSRPGVYSHSPRFLRVKARSPLTNLPWYADRLLRVIIVCFVTSYTQRPLRRLHSRKLCK